MDGGALQAAIHGVAKSRARLSDFTFTFHFHALEKEMATHSSVLAWRIPGTGSLVGCSLWGRTESDMTEATQQQQQQESQNVSLQVIIFEEINLSGHCLHEKKEGSILLQTCTKSMVYMLTTAGFVSLTFHLIKCYSSLSIKCHKITNLIH